MLKKKKIRINPKVPLPKRNKTKPKMINKITILKS